MNELRHAGRIVAITGGSSGIGQAIVVRLVSEGAKVAVIDTADASETIALGNAQGGEVSGYTCDISDWSQMQAVAQSIRTDVGDPSILVHCAAYQFMRPFSDLSVEDFHKVQDVNVNVPQAHFDHVVAHQAVKRSGEPEDQAAALSFMVSEDAGFMTGQTMLIDGGEGHL